MVSSIISIDPTVWEKHRMYFHKTWWKDGERAKKDAFTFWLDEKGSCRNGKKLGRAVAAIGECRLIFCKYTFRIVVKRLFHPKIPSPTISNTK